MSPKLGNYVPQVPFLSYNIIIFSQFGSYSNFYGMSNVSSKPLWFIDFGATNHVIVNSANLVVSHSYSGKNHLIVGNGDNSM